MYQDISKCIKPYLSISCYDAIVGFCGRFDFLGFFDWCWNSKHICSSGFFEFINFNFYVITKSWHAHQKDRLHELVWKKWVSDIFMDTFIKLSINSFKTYSCDTYSFCWNIIIICSIGPGNQKSTPPLPITHPDFTLEADLFTRLGLPKVEPGPPPRPPLRRTS